MATNQDFIEYVCEQIPNEYSVRYKKMFGEYMVYVNEKPIFLVCDNIVYVKKLECLNDILKNVEQGYPYKGSKEHYMLEIEDLELTNNVVSILEKVTPIPKKKK